MKTTPGLASPRTIELLGYELLDEPLPPLLSSTAQLHVATLNPHSFVVAREDRVFWAALMQADVLVADGAGMVLASTLLRGRKVLRITGGDVCHTLLDELVQRGGRCFFLGSTPQVLAQIEQQLATSAPSIEVGTYSPPFAADFSPAQVAEMIERVNAFSPDVLFLGLTAPKQEKLAEQLRGRAHARVIASVGAVFDFLAGTQVRAPAWMRAAGLEWAYRLAREPRRLWRRNFVSSPLFLAAVLAARWSRLPRRASSETTLR